MEANEKIFRHSFGKLALMFLGVLFLGFFAFFDRTDYFLVGLTGIALVIALFYTLSSIKISNEEITTTRLLGSKSLRWSEIARVSMRGQTLRLHNYDEDLILSIDPQLDGYTEILDAIFRKRPDLFDNNENTVMSGSWLGNLFTVGLGLLMMAIPLLPLFVAGEFDKVVSLLFFVIGMAIVVNWFLAPKNLTLQSKSLIVGYLFKEVSYSVDDIRSISLERKNTRNGYIYFALINLKSGKKIKPPNIKQGSALTYQILRRWHEKARNPANEVR